MQPELIARLRLLKADHEPDGWPAIRMRDVSALLDALESQASAMDRCYKMLLSEPDTKGALFKAENILREALAGGKDVMRQQEDVLRAEIADQDALREHLAKILTDTANALKGQPSALRQHSWHDLAKVAAATKKESNNYRLAVVDLATRGHGVARPKWLTKTIESAMNGEGK